MPVPTVTDTRSVWLHVGTLVDGTSPQAWRDAHVVYNAREVLFVGRDGATPPRALAGGLTAPDVDAPGATLLPGLIDAHAHFFLEGGELDIATRAAYLEQAPTVLLARARERLAPLVRLGIAGVRDAGDKHGVGLALSRLSKTVDAPLMPYVESPGAAINHKGRYGGFMSEPLEDFASPADAVAERIAAGADRIKLIATGIINFKMAEVTGAPQMTADEVRLLADEARSHGRQTFAHASGAAGIDCALHGGVDSVEHGFFLRDDQLSYMRDHRIAWVPTFAPVQEQIDHADLMGWDAQASANLVGIIERHSTSLVKAQAMGVLVIAGSDAGSVGVAHGLGLLREMALMERAGLSPIAVINSATGVSAGRLDYREPLGRIAPGFRSRFILTTNSPLESVANLSRARTVIFDGDVFETGEQVDGRGL